ncbi:TniQ protein [Micromonospora echinofusca]|uniref:TniQ protein n=1 Tax=Micromonospora echinofusca TaxID=47858 RepID=A0A1C5GCJ4_MICEH|nr:TniQ protein [Micromonospora echinofusca]
MPDPRDPYWQRRLRPLPIPVRPMPRELMISYLRRLANANRVDRPLLIRHIATDHAHHIGPLHTHDLALNRPALARLAILSGYPEAVLLAAISTRTLKTPGPEPLRDWIPLGGTGPTLLRPCSHCTARHGIRVPAIIQLEPGPPPICIRHRRTLVPYHYRSDRGNEQPLGAAPEIVTAAHRYKILRRRHRNTIGEAFAAAANITRLWGRGRVGHYRDKSEQINARWNARTEHLPHVPDTVIRYPETIALTSLFASAPTLMLTPTEDREAPSTMQFLLAVARCLDHPAPEQLLRPAHPLFRWAGGWGMPTWFWRNIQEPDRTIYRTLAQGSTQLNPRPARRDQIQ